MKGLILKDIYGLGVYKKTILLMLGITLVMSFVNGSDFSFVPAMMTMFVVMISITLFSLDETSGWDKYALALPLGRTTIVAARYLFLLVLLIVTLAASFGLGVAGSLAFGIKDWLPELATTSATMVVISLFMCAIFCPFAYKYGANKSRFALMGVCLIPFLGFVVLMPYLEPHLAALDASPAAIIGAGIGGCALLYAASYFLSLRIYTKKEF